RVFATRLRFVGLGFTGFRFLGLRLAVGRVAGFRLRFVGRRGSSVRIAGTVEAAHHAAVVLGADGATPFGGAARDLGLALPDPVLALAVLAVRAATHRFGTETVEHARQHGLVGDGGARIDLVARRVTDRGIEAAGPGVVTLGRLHAIAQIVAFAFVAADVPPRRTDVGRDGALAAWEVVPAGLSGGFVAQILVAAPRPDATRHARVLLQIGEAFALPVGTADDLRFALLALDEL